VPHDVNGLIALHGSKENLEKKLDDLFSASEKTRGREQADVTGLIGQYAHGNEPSHHMAYLYNFVDKPEKASARVNQICSNFYKNSPDGLIGNEDCGQMSAWYVLSALGMYQVCPGDARFTLVPPQFKESVIHLENGNNFAIHSTPKEGEEWVGLTTASRVLLRTELPFSEIQQGGKLNYVFGKPGSEKKLNPTATMVNGVAPVLAPLVVSNSQVFRASMQFSLVPLGTNDQTLIYTLNGLTPAQGAMSYSSPITIDSNCVINVRAVKGTDTSAVTVAHFYKIKYDYDVKVLTKANAQYEADGAQTLIDGMPAQTDWRKGNWLGFQSNNLEIVIDLKQKKKLQDVSLVCLQDSRSWILFPAKVQLMGSKDGKKYEPMGEVLNDIKADDYTVHVKEFKIADVNFKEYRYIKLVALQYGRLPDWHAGKGGDSFIFAGELNIH
jgi:hypothetical protein